MHPDDKTQSSPERALLGASEEPNAMGVALLSSRSDQRLPSPIHSVPATPPSASMLSHSNVTIQGGTPQFIIQGAENPNSGLESVFTQAAPNAILNDGGRADEVRCHPGTREEVLAKCEGWMDAGPQFDNSRSGIFWLSGPAGAGKSAIMQTLAERAAARRRTMLNFFFFRNDSTRNDARPLVATLLVQLFDILPALKVIIRTVLANRPMIFRQSIQDQFRYLIDEPLRNLRNTSPSLSPIVLLIDGLDECSSDARSKQKTLLKVVHSLISRPGSPCAALIASRPEPHLIMTFNEIGSSSDSICLNEGYRPEKDILKFVTDELARIKETHHLGHTLDRDWPLPADVDAIVRKSSGQFIFAATVLRFIAGSAASPALSLDKIQGLQPVKKSSPCAELDAIYAYILSDVEDWQFTRDILAMQLLDVSPHNGGRFPSGTLDFQLDSYLIPLGHRAAQLASGISDLTAITTREIRHQLLRTPQIKFYHASFPDFLLNETRSGIYHISLQNFCERSAPRYIECAVDKVSLITLCSVMSIINALLRGPQRAINRLATAVVFNALENFCTYCAGDDQLFERIVLKWIATFAGFSDWDNFTFCQLLQDHLHSSRLPKKSRQIVKVIIDREVSKRGGRLPELSPQFSIVTQSSESRPPTPQYHRSAPPGKRAVTPIQHQHPRRTRTTQHQRPKPASEAPQRAIRTTSSNQQPVAGQAAQRQIAESSAQATQRQIAGTSRRKTAAATASPQPKKRPAWR